MRVREQIAHDVEVVDLARFADALLVRLELLVLLNL